MNLWTYHVPGISGFYRSIMQDNGRWIARPEGGGRVTRSAGFLQTVPVFGGLINLFSTHVCVCVCIYTVESLPYIFTRLCKNRNRPDTEVRLKTVVLLLFLSCPSFLFSKSGHPRARTLVGTDTAYSSDGKSHLPFHAVLYTIHSKLETWWNLKVGGCCYQNSAKTFNHSHDYNSHWNRHLCD